jgi:hypothetical protein
VYLLQRTPVLITSRYLKKKEAINEHEVDAIQHQYAMNVSFSGRHQMVGRLATYEQHGMGLL